jgi:hypothetical protein
VLELYGVFSARRDPRSRASRVTASAGCKWHPRRRLVVKMVAKEFRIDWYDRLFIVDAA